jgi:predicted transcriptional regulator
MTDAGPSLRRVSTPLCRPKSAPRLTKGEGLLKALRNWRDMTQMELSFRTALGQGYLSDLESGRRKGTPKTLKSIAAALNAQAEWLVG